MPIPIPPADLFLQVEELPGRAGKPYTISGERTYTRKWRVRARQKGIGPLLACSAPGIPRPGAFYLSDIDNIVEGDVSALLTDLSAAEQPNKDDWGDYEVTAQYNTRLPAGGPQGNGIDPSKRDDPTGDFPDIRWGWDNTVHVVRFQDLDGYRFINSAGQVLTGVRGGSGTISCPQLTISRNELAFNQDVAALYAFAVNSKPFLGYKRWAVQCLPPTAESRWKGAFQYWRVTYSLRFFPPYVHNRDLIGGFALNPQTGKVYSEAYINSYLNTWQTLVLDAGTEEYKRIGTVFSAKGAQKISAAMRTPIYVKHKPVTQPVMLNGEGEQLREADEPAMLPYYLPFREYQDADFTALINRGFV